MLPAGPAFNADIGVELPSTIELRPVPYYCSPVISCGAGVRAWLLLAHLAGREESLRLFLLLLLLQLRGRRLLGGGASNCAQKFSTGPHELGRSLDP